MKVSMFARCDTKVSSGSTTFAALFASITTSQRLAELSNEARTLYTAERTSAPHCACATANEHGKANKCEGFHRAAKDRRSDQKCSMGAVTPAGSYTTREGFPDAHSGCVVIDIDHLEESEALDGARQFAANLGAMLAYRSPSGAGVKAIHAVSPTPTTTEEHTAAWAAVAAHWSDAGFEVDRSGKDAARLCYVAYDEQAHWNPNPTIIPWHYEAPTPAPAPAIAAPVQGSGLDTQVRSALAAIPADDYGDWITIGGAIKGAGGTQADWDEWSRSSSNYDEKKIAPKWATFDGRAAAGTIIKLARHYGWSESQGADLPEPPRFADPAVAPTRTLAQVAASFAGARAPTEADAEAVRAFEYAGHNCAGGTSLSATGILLVCSPETCRVYPEERKEWAQ